MSKSVPAKIQPSLLVWARETAGYSLEDAASKLHVATDKLLAAETGEGMLTFNQLQLAAGAYKRPLALFFLPEPPPREAPTHDFRLDREVAHQPPEPSVNIELRRARQRRDEALALAREIEVAVPTFEAQAALRENPERVAARVTQLLQITDDQTRTWKTPEVAFKARKAAVEALGVLVFEASRVPTEQMRGAAIFFDQLPVIILNGADSPTGRSFTLMHELTHLLLRQGGICDLAPSEATTPDAKVERFCNAVAAAVLMPANKLLAMLGDKQVREWTLDELGLLTKPFYVSREAMLVRLITLGRASQRQYVALRPQFREEYQRFKESQRKDGGGGPSPAVMALKNLGRPFVRLVLDAYEDDRIDLSTVSDYLGVKLRHLPRIRELAAGTLAAA